MVSSLSVSDRPVHTCAPNGHLLRVTIPDAVLIQFDLLRMNKILLETVTFFLNLCTGRSLTDSDDTRCRINTI